MCLSAASKLKAQDTFNVLTLLAGIVLLVAISWEIIAGDNIHFSHAYMNIQLIVCLLFILDFFVRWTTTKHRRRFFVYNIFFLIFSIPYLNIIVWSGVELSRDWAMLMGIIPLLRTFLALYVVVRWLVDNKIRQLLVAYIFTVVVFTYLSALVFYDYEVLVNDKLHGFGNALWWAWMNVTTVGAEIFAVTAIGKIITILLPSLGMMMFPIFTSYILQQYTRQKKSGS